MTELLVGPLRSVGGASGQDARELNRRSVLHAIASGAAITRADLARFTGLTRPTVSSLVEELVDHGLVVETGQGPSAGGKRPTLLAVDGAARQVIAIDVSSDAVVGALSDLVGASSAIEVRPGVATGDELVDEINEQPDVLARLFASQRKVAADVADRWCQLSPTHVLIASRGSSDNAGRYAQYLWGQRAGLTVGLAVPSLFGHDTTPPRLTGAAVVGISQSGASPDLVAVLEEAGRQGRPTLAITNEPGSALAAAADQVLALGGRDRSVRWPQPRPPRHSSAPSR